VDLQLPGTQSLVIDRGGKTPEVMSKAEAKGIVRL
jgi:hypothetical protein